MLGLVAEMEEMHWLELAQVGMLQHVRVLDDQENIVAFACSWLYIGRKHPALEQQYTCLNYICFILAHEHSGPLYLLQSCHGWQQICLVLFQV